MSLLQKYALKALAWVAGSSVVKDQAPKIASAIVIKGKTIPVEDVEALLGAVAQALALAGDGKDAAAIRAEIAPVFLEVAEDIASLLIPYGGTAVALAAWAIKNSRPMTFEEEQAWMARATEGIENR